MSRARPRQCEATRLQRKWTRERCKRNATVIVHGQRVCEQHAKILTGVAHDVTLTAPGQRL